MSQRSRGAWSCVLIIMLISFINGRALMIRSALGRGSLSIPRAATRIPSMIKMKLFSSALGATHDLSTLAGLVPPNDHHRTAGRPRRSDLEKQLYAELAQWRKRTADELQRPLSNIASNQLLETIAKRKPKNLDQLSLLNSVGKYKLREYGDAVMKIVSKYPHPEDPKGFTFAMEELVDTQKFWQDAAMKKKKKKSPGADGNKKKPPRRKSLGVLSPDQNAAIEEAELLSRLTLEDLTEDKQVAAQRVLEGRNLFITGNAGTGKSFLLKFAIQELIAKYGEDAVAVTGSTGISAVSIGGQTLHSFAGVGIGVGDPAKIAARVLKNKSCVDRWLQTKVLVIDEISMVDRALFELVDEIARKVRGIDQPFGGIQLIVVGDFSQLPPVRHQQRDGSQGNFCFQSPTWDAAGLNTRDGAVYLETVVRQVDKEFVQYLNEVRVGIFSPAFQRRLAACMSPFKPLPSDGIVPTKLYATNVQVDNENQKHLAALPGQSVIISAEDNWKVKPTKTSSATYLREVVDKQIPSQIELKIGAQVMLLRNRSRMTYGGNIKSTGPSLVNGSRGRIVAFSESVTRPGMLIPTVLFDNGMETTIGPVEYLAKGPNGDGEIVRFQVPLKLAWATTVHKSQGCTLTRAQLILDKAFDYGQVYVALSRVRDLDALWLSAPIPPSAVKAHPDVLRFYGYLD